MKRILILLLIFFVTFTAYAADNFRAGIAYRVVTPDPLLGISGGIGATQPVDEKKGDLNVRALVMEHNDLRVAIVSTDFLGFPAVLGDRVRDMVDNIPPENILIGATHTHSAPDMYAFPSEIGKISADLEYIDWVCQKTAEAINEAVEQLQPAYVRIATGKAQGKIAYNYYAPQLYDPRCHVMQFINPKDGAPIATLVNYAIHPEVLGPGSGILSPDMVGPLYDRLEAKGAGTPIFMNSALGGMVTADVRGPDGKDIQTWDECIRIGHLLADEALRIIADAPIQKEPSLICRSKTITFPMDSPIMRHILKESPLGYELDERGLISTRLNLVNVGNAQMLTIPGEALPNIGYYLKRKMNGKHNFLLGLTNDAFGYIMTKVDYDSFDRYDYITRTSLGEMTGEIYIEECLDLIAKSPPPDEIKKD